MDKRILRERMRRKKRQLMMRKIMRLVMCTVAVILVLVFVFKGVISPIAKKIMSSDGKTVEVQAQTAQADPNAAVRRPVKGVQDVSKTTVRTAGWQEDENGKWYQNVDGSYYASGMQDIDGVTYYFNDQGYVQTGWVTLDNKDYFFNDDGSYNPEKQRPMVALTFDDGPGPYTDKLLDCLEENGAKATFFMLGKNAEQYPDVIKRMKEIGCELGNHSYNHLNMTTIPTDQVIEQFDKTNEIIKNACGEPASVLRFPYGSFDSERLAAVNMPSFLWSLDTEDWKKLDAQADYDSVIGHVSDGEIVLMHDIHEASVEAALKIIPELINQGYKLVTLEEMAEAKGLSLENGKSYTDFWAKTVEGMKAEGQSGSTDAGSQDSGSSTIKDESEPVQGMQDAGTQESDSQDQQSDDTSSEDESSDSGVSPIV